ncbi:MAG TPA: helix-turn-helix transcriptional regulator, partial [Trueperaceae bacterium]|nr:helix-turn-helix transcriptional regulator [Trueperaceae bacterium]
MKFRNIDADPAAPVSTWPTEAVMAALERGGLSEWRRLAAAVRDDPWGRAARRLESALKAVRPYGIAPLMDDLLADARRAAEESERREVARRVASLLQESGLTRADFAEAIGTSTSRLSTYLSGKVAPSSGLLV